MQKYIKYYLKTCILRSYNVNYSVYRQSFGAYKSAERFQLKGREVLYLPLLCFTKVVFYKICHK